MRESYVASHRPTRNPNGVAPRAGRRTSYVPDAPGARSLTANRSRPVFRAPAASHRSWGADPEGAFPACSTHSSTTWRRRCGATGFRNVRVGAAPPNCAERIRPALHVSAGHAVESSRSATAGSSNCQRCTGTTSPKKHPTLTQTFQPRECLILNLGMGTPQGAIPQVPRTSPGRPSARIGMLGIAAHTAVASGAGPGKLFPPTPERGSARGSGWRRPAARSGSP
jgi:hypothetical protein